MIVLGVAFNVAEFVTFAVVVFQFLASLFTGKPNDRLARSGRNLARYLQQVTVYMTFATEEKPFPFTPWPDEPHDEASGGRRRQSAGPQGGERRGCTTENDDADEAKKADDTEATDNAEDADKPKD